MGNNLKEGWYTLDHGAEGFLPRERIATTRGWSARLSGEYSGAAAIGYWNGASWLHMHYRRCPDAIRADKLAILKRRMLVVVGAVAVYWGAIAALG